MRLLAMLAQPALACTVCFGGVEGRLAEGLTWGIVLLIAVTFSILAAFAVAVVRIEKNRNELVH